MPGVRTIMDIGDNSEEEDGEYMVSVQSGASGHSLGFEDKNLGRPPPCLGSR